ncbi:hypothetical protein QYE76_055341 [Lolium multiflorum]|uniref:Transposase (putative) gypsy type domain-containing protein n=1 Tax=Lolium multiflorum TaxID=4521 RepID=A0AAD8SZL7_LOLMU|nr:hypothetical protein QYE76_055341 [Lolium multiflorum]
MFIDPIAFLPSNISDIRLAQPFSASFSNYLNRIPTIAEIQEEIEGQARMAAKVQESEQKKASNARTREVLNTYGLQPHNICPNSYILLSNFVTLCEGHIGILPDVRLWQFFYRVKKETKDKAMVNCGSMTFVLFPQRMYPSPPSHESARY